MSAERRFHRIRCGCMIYVYLDGKYLCCSPNPSDVAYSALHAMGYTWEELDDIAYYRHDIPPEMPIKKGKYGIEFDPPEQLSTLLERIQKWKLRLRDERISDLEKELEELRSERTHES